MDDFVFKKLDDYVGLSAKQWEVVLEFPLTAQAIVVLAAVAYWQSVTVSNFVDTLKKKKRPKRTETTRREEKRANVSLVLPDDILCSAFLFLEAVTVASVASVVCERWKRVSDSDAHWLAAFSRDFQEEEEEASYPWKVQYSIYSETWLEKSLVGANREGESVCLGLHGSLYDVTTFLPHHPGTTDTLLEFAGADATVFFEDVGHSTVAKGLLDSFLVKENPKVGALASIQTMLQDSKKEAEALTPDSCCGGHCGWGGGLYQKPNLYFDKTQWKCWWPCCGHQIDLPVGLHGAFLEERRHKRQRRRQGNDQESLLAIANKYFLLR